MLALVPTPDLVFEPTGHRYVHAGRTLTGVTEAIKGCGLIDDRWFTEQAVLRGTYVHRALEYLDQGDLDEATIDSALTGYVDAYRRFLRECHAGDVHLYEVPLADPVRGYAGTLDRVRHIGPHLAVMDIKTGDPQRWHGLQLAAYAELAKRALGMPMLKRWGLYLRADGTYRCHPYTDRHDWDVFQSCLTVAQFKRRSAV
jgi:hypothetical protein